MVAVEGPSNEREPHNHSNNGIPEDEQSDNIKITKHREKKEKLKVATASIVASAGLMILKLVMGLVTNSLGLLAEGLHSGLDVIAAMMTFYAIRIIMRPADLKYTYGYAKYESLSSLTEVILLFAVAAWIFYEGIERLFFKSIQPEITLF